VTNQLEQIQTTWICCDWCIKWYHLGCVKNNDRKMEVKDDEEWFCTTECEKSFREQKK